MPERQSMQDQYRRIKARYRDAILFFRLGDFYEMFHEDALEASSLLDLTLTQRQGQPMCGIPYHAARSYIGRLLKAGRKVAICEQLPVPGQRGIMDREVIEVVTPGTTIEEEYIEHGGNNYLAGACTLQGHLCIACLDVSTGEFRAASSPDDSRTGMEFLKSEISRLSPRELIIQQSLCDRSDVTGMLREFEDMLVERRPDWSFDRGKAFADITRRFNLSSLKGFGFQDDAPELAAAGVLLEYLDENVKTRSPHIKALLPFSKEEYLSLDEATRRNLELVRNLMDSGRRDTLLSVMDRTKTAGGGRLLRQWLLQPLRKKEAIEARLDAVAHLHRDQILLGGLRRALGQVLDTERLIARLAMDKANAKDLRALADSLEASLDARAILARAPQPLPRELDGSREAQAAEACRDIVDRIRSALIENPSVLLTEGNLIRDGYDADVDRFRSLKTDSTRILEAYLEEERQNSGIAALRIRYNRIIGYYLEVTKGKLDAVPSHFIRRQSLVTGERYTTDRLVDIESQINGATEKLNDLERRLFLGMRESLVPGIGAMEQLARYLAGVDCLASLAQAATEWAWTRPLLVEEPVLSIRQGRHPVVEACLPGGSFVPNDLELDSREKGFALVTGPNMAGKSTVLRQSALIVLMAHAGSFVPADEATIGLVDRIFCRVGAQDNLARGESTFLVEMHETAYILNTATASSLVIMDEVGRGTGTLDGVSIAWAVSEQLLSQIRCRTLFATHYHELTSMDHPAMLNLSMAVLENAGEIVFLKKLSPGAAAGSYGIHVAGLAGIPEDVLVRARQLQEKFSRFERSLSPLEAIRTGALSAASVDAGSKYDEAAPHARRKSAAGTPAPELFSTEDLVLDRLKGCDPDRMTPLQALGFISELHGMLE
jgi:DNA mismatch repair protein MutS